MFSASNYILMLKYEYPCIPYFAYEDTFNKLSRERVVGGIDLALDKRSFQNLKLKSLGYSKRANISLLVNYIDRIILENGVLENLGEIFFCECSMFFCPNIVLLFWQEGKIDVLREWSRHLKIRLEREYIKVVPIISNLELVKEIYKNFFLFKGKEFKNDKLVLQLVRNVDQLEEVKELQEGYSKIWRSGGLRIEERANILEWDYIIIGGYDKVNFPLGDYMAKGYFKEEGTFQKGVEDEVILFF